MDRQKYNACISSGMKGKKLTKEERQLEFCVVAKTCSGKAKTREEALQICSQPKPPKQPRATKGAKKGQSCEKGVINLTQCVIDNLDKSGAYRGILNINSAGQAIANALMECQCPKQQ